MSVLLPRPSVFGPCCCQSCQHALSKSRKEPTMRHGPLTNIYILIYIHVYVYMFIYIYIFFQIDLLRILVTSMEVSFYLLFFVWFWPKQNLADLTTFIILFLCVHTYIYIYFDVYISRVSLYAITYLSVQQCVLVCNNVSICTAMYTRSHCRCGY